MTSSAPAEAVYAGPEMLDVYAGPEFFKETPPQNERSREPGRRPPIALVYAAPEYFKKKNKIRAEGGKFCTNCGRALEDDFRFCPECGVRCTEADKI